MSQHRARSRLLRRGRVSIENQVYLITSTTHGRRPHFSELGVARAVCRAIGLETWATTVCFVVMPDHLHWLMSLEGGADLSRVIGRVKSISARWAKQSGVIQDRVWQPGFHDRALRRGEDLRSVARYVVANPLRAGLVRSIREYPHWDAIWL